MRSIWEGVKAAEQEVQILNVITLTAVLCTVIKAVQMVFSGTNAQFVDLVYQRINTDTTTTECGSFFPLFAGYLLSVGASGEITIKNLQ